MTRPPAQTRDHELMARLVRTPQEVLDQVKRLLPQTDRRRSEPTSLDRILDAALASFSIRGIKATTMTSIARDAGVSREWLYRQFANRDAVVLAVAQREVAAFIDGLATRPFDAEDLDGAITETFVYSVEWLRDHTLLQQVLATEADIISGEIMRDASPMVAMAVRVCAGYLSAIGDLDVDESVLVAETLIRLVATITLSPAGVLDLHDPDQLRRFAGSIVPGVLYAARTTTTTP